MYVIKLSLSLIDTLHRRNGQFFHRWNLTTTILKSERAGSQCRSFDRSRNNSSIFNLKSIKLETIKQCTQYIFDVLKRLMNWTLVDNAFEGSFKMFRRRAIKNFLSECAHSFRLFFKTKLWT